MRRTLKYPIIELEDSIRALAAARDVLMRLADKLRYLNEIDLKDCPRIRNGADLTGFPVRQAGSRLH